MNKIKLPIAVLSILSAGLYAVVVNADHAWGKYHWDLSTAQSTDVPLQLGANLIGTGVWDEPLRIASVDWNESVLINKLDIGLSNPNCDPTPGRVEVCNDGYGFNGWLGIASIWATRGKSNHITQATVRVNDTYFSADYSNGYYDSPAWRDFVMCQEVGHTFGLGHQDENFDNANLGTCMDYTSYPDGLDANGDIVDLDNRRPNQHDYDMLTDMYAHLNSTDGGSGGGGGGNGGGRKPKKSNPGDNKSPNNPSEWGQAVRQDAQGRNSVYERTLANGQILITHVLWAIEANEEHDH